MKRVLYVAHENTKGGATHSLINILDHLPENVRPYVLIPKTLSFRMLFSKDYQAMLKAGTLKQELIKRKILFFEAYYFLDNLKVKQNMLRSLFFSIIRSKEIMNVKRKIEAEDIQIIHSNSSVIKFGAELAKKIGIKHIWHVREDIKAMFDSDEENQKNYYRSIMENADKIIFVAENLKRTFQNTVQRMFKDTYEKQEENFIRIYNGVPLTTSIKKTSKQQSIFNIYCFGTVYEIKGQEDLIKLADKLKAEGITNFKIKLVGTKKQDYYDHLVELINKYQLTNEVEFIDYASELTPFRNDANIEVVSSRNEAFGRVAIEAMNFGNPLIVTNVGGLDEIVEHGKNGLKYKPGDIDSLFENVMLIMRNGIDVDKLIVNAKSRSKEFDINECVSQICKLYEQEV